MKPKMNHRRRGAAKVAALGLIPLLGFTSMVVDLGMLDVAKGELQAAVDATAVGAVGYLDGTAEGAQLAIVEAVNLAAMNSVLGETLVLDPTDVSVGVYDASTDTFTAVDPTFYATPEDINTVVIDPGARQMRTALAQLFGHETLAIPSRATQVHRQAGHEIAGTSACFLPFAIPDCHIPATLPGTNPAPFKLSWQTGATNVVGWTDRDAAPSVMTINGQFDNSCDYYDHVMVGDTTYLNTLAAPSSLSKISDILNGLDDVTPDAWPTDLGSVPTRDGTVANTTADSMVSSLNYGNVIQGVVPVVSAGACGAPDLTDGLEVTGFAWAVIYDVSDTTGQENVWLQLDLINQHDIWGLPDTNSTMVNANVKVPHPGKIQN
jgi:Flp pilus assembly protein TadG